MTQSSKKQTVKDKEPVTLVEMLSQHAEKQPDNIAIIYLKDGEQEEVAITYRELDHRARLIAARLSDLDGEDERVLLLYPPGLDYIAAFFGCLYAGVVAVPAYPPRLNRPVPRIRAIVADSGAKTALTTRDIFAGIEKRFEFAPDLEALNWIQTEDLPASLETEWQEPIITPQTLAFLQYTSGSTSTPKGVMLNHANLLYNLKQITVAFNVSSQDVAVSWLPSYHDMGLIGTILGAIYAGTTLILMAPLDFLQRPIRWLKAITRYKATVTGGPNFAYDLCVDRIKPEQIGTLDLSSLRIAFSGAEPVRLETIEKFSEKFAPCGFRKQAFYPCYGLAECTLIVSGGDASAEPVTLTVKRSALELGQIVEASPGDADAQTLVGCGAAVLGEKITIVNPETYELCTSGTVGEIWVEGNNVALGYWQRKEENEHTFGAQIAGSNEGIYMRTGDLGFIYDNELFIAGRIKDLIIIRGSNHYPQDIELTVERCHESLQLAGGCAFSVDVNGEERLVVVQEVDRKYRRTNLGPAIQAIRKAVAQEHDLQVYAVVLIKPFTIPKTSSGKIQRHACKKKFLEGSLDVITEWRAG